jgi:hypothetical protein
MNYDDPRDYRKKRVQDFLKKMSQIESSGGKNLDHPVITDSKSIHAGTKAVGEYGMMPLTAQEMDKRFKTNELQGMDKVEAQEYLEQNPELVDRLAKSMASKLVEEHGEGEDSNYMWQHGHNKAPSKEKVAKAERTKKFRVLNKKKDESK